MQHTLRAHAKNTVLYALIGAGALTTLMPFFWMLSSSLMTIAEMFYFPPKWIPNPPQWRNYADTINAMPFLRFTWNTLYISGVGTLGMLLVSSIAAYAFGRMRFPGKEPIFMVLMACMMIPGQVTMIPVFLIMRWLGWVNTPLPLIVPMFFGGAFGIFMLRQFYATIPMELEEAARIDGCGRLRIIFQIMMPLTKPALATLGVFTFMGKWNDLLGPVIYLNDFDKMTLTVGLALFKGQYTTQYNLLMCGAVISMLPILTAYVFAQRYFVQGIVMTGLKG
ncbi:MAG: carbohydrate ABC transporter permease [Clostridiales bacterium]|nr:carbohydrate ABC transporter permease [Clostridiales bacterium]